MTDHPLNEYQQGLAYCLETVEVPFATHSGKVRDIWENEQDLFIASTDRLSAFDRNLTLIPFKGAVTNLTSAWWFEQLEGRVPHHLISVSDPNVSRVRKCEVLPIEMIVRGYMTGSTSTSLWTHYQKGVRHYCGNAIPEGLVKNQKLPENIVTPTTKSDVHDELISGEEIVSGEILDQATWERIHDYALDIFLFGQEVAAKHGLILVDTKYEFGRAEDGSILLIDEVHTPDSSRYWIADSYDERFSSGQEPENIDKEFIRLWYREHCDPYNDKELPQAPDELRMELSRRYVQLYERITGQSFPFHECLQDPRPRIRHNLGLN